MRKIYLGQKTMNNALLDTHVFYWIMQESPKIGNDTLDKLYKFDNIYISPITIWEIALLEKKSKLKFNISLEDWTRQSLMRSGFKLAPCDISILILSNNLPGNFHNDPCDRIIASTANVMGATLFTRDKQILEYAKKGNLVCEEV